MEGLRALIPAFEMITVPAGHEVIVEGEEGAEAYIVARGELEVRRNGAEGEEPVTLARLVGGALFGEMALLSRAPRAASVVACGPNASASPGDSNVRRTTPNSSKAAHAWINRLIA
jgi:cAMP-dependent protein kinase regulator